MLSPTQRFSWTFLTINAHISIYKWYKWILLNAKYDLWPYALNWSLKIPNICYWKSSHFNLEVAFTTKNRFWDSATGRDFCESFFPPPLCIKNNYLFLLFLPIPWKYYPIFFFSKTESLHPTFEFYERFGMIID